MKSLKQDVPRSLQIVHVDESGLPEDEDIFKSIGCDTDSLVKVISIFGNTGEGKSYTLNHIFFDGEEVFQVSPAQESCTLGVWAAYDKLTGTLILDTEGMLGATTHEKQRMRLLVKILAISDLVVYRTRAERLTSDMFKFLSNASQAYLNHFQKELQNTSEKCKIDMPVSSLGPSVIVFHETVHTNILEKENSLSPGEQLRRMFQGQPIGAFSAIEYVGTKTQMPPTNFSGIKSAIEGHLNNFTVRSPRPASLVFSIFRTLNEVFSGQLTNTDSDSYAFLNEYFTCTSKCLSCNEQCTHRMNHHKDGKPHDCKNNCVFQAQFNNYIYYCKRCYDDSKRNMVVRKTSSRNDTMLTGFFNYAIYGYLYECPHCGIIYQSRQNWFGNEDPTLKVIHSEPAHVWPDGTGVVQGTEYALQRMIDNVNTVASTLGDLTVAPTTAVTDWVADKVAPSYWKPNSSLTQCTICSREFGYLLKKHHCRSCGSGVCDDCSKNKKHVDGWGETRVCDNCVDKVENNECSVKEQDDITARKVTDTVQSLFSVVSSVVKYPMQVIKENARPAYWVPDEEVSVCTVCSTKFGDFLTKHHCRACGTIACDNCSKKRQPVPLRGWDAPVRICDKCAT